jgi:hypothetical protein
VLRPSQSLERDPFSVWRSHLVGLLLSGLYADDAPPAAVVPTAPSVGTKTDYLFEGWGRLLARAGRQ